MMAPARPSMRLLVSTDSGGLSPNGLSLPWTSTCGGLPATNRQIRNALGALDHGRQQPVKFFCRDRFHRSDWGTVIHLTFPTRLDLRVGFPVRRAGLQLFLHFPRPLVEEPGLQQISDPQGDFRIINRLAKEIVRAGRHCLTSCLGRVLSCEHQHRQEIPGRRCLPKLFQNGEPIRLRHV